VKGNTQADDMESSSSKYLPFTDGINMLVLAVAGWDKDLNSCYIRSWTKLKSLYLYLHVAFS
jgi:hypothetical protein